jgi:hypothetical protein
VFEAWTKSEAFRAAHSRAGDNKPLYLDHLQFEDLRCGRLWDAAKPRHGTYVQVAGGVNPNFLPASVTRPTSTIGTKVPARR